MSERKLIEKKCDQCGELSTFEEGKFGNHPHAGWFELKTDITQDTYNPISGDFCTPKCLVDHVIEKAKLPYAVIELDYDDEGDYEDMDVTELRRKCKMRSIPATGDGTLIGHAKKGKLILALEHWDGERGVGELDT